MPLDALLQVDIIQAMENYMEAVRPPIHIRNQVDIGYKIENTSIFVFEIRPSFRDKKIIQELEVAKATYRKKTDNWKMFWLRSSLKWYTYKTDHELKSIHDVITQLKDDRYACFWG